MKLDYGDLLGSACLNASKLKSNLNLTVDTTFTEGEELTTDYLMRSYKQMPKTEQFALDQSKGKVLDLGAGAGIHSLYLQDRPQVTRVEALEISENFCQLMLSRGVEHIHHTDFFAFSSPHHYDTILLLMNGLGMCKTLEGLPLMLKKLSTHLSHTGCIYIESTDIKYLFEQEDGSFLIPFDEKYYGEIEYQVSYAGHKAKAFDWLYCSYELLEAHCSDLDLSCELVMTEEDKFLAKISK